MQPASSARDAPGWARATRAGACLALLAWSAQAADPTHAAQASWDADPHVTWIPSLDHVDLDIRLPPLDPAGEPLAGFGLLDFSLSRNEDPRLDALDPVPVRYVRVPLPPGVAARLRVLELTFADGSSAALPATWGPRAAAAPALPGEHAPAQPIELVGTGIDGDQRFAHLRLTPVLRGLDGAGDLTLRRAHARLLLGEVRGPDGIGTVGPVLPGEALAAARDRGPWAALRARIRVARTGWQQVDRAALSAAIPELLSLPAWRLGLTRAGRPVPCRVEETADGTLASLGFHGQARLDEAEEGTFQGGDFTDEETYFLVDFGPEAAPRIATRDAAPEGLRDPVPALSAVTRFEVDSFFYNTVARPGLDHWAWGPALRSDGSTPAVREIPLDLPGLPADASSDVTFLVTWHGRGEDLERPHRVTFGLDGEPMAELFWVGFEQVVQRVTAPTARVAGSARMTLAVPGEAGTGEDAVSLDAVVVGHPRRPVAVDDACAGRVSGGRRRVTVEGFTSPEILALDLSAPDHPVELVGGDVSSTPDGFSLSVDVESSALGRPLAFVAAPAFLRPVVERSAPMELRHPETGADWIAVLPSALGGSRLLPELVAARARSGLTPLVVPLQDVFDTFSDGRPDPRALRELMRAARAGWPAPRPRYLLLLGDGSKDYKGAVDPGGSVLPALLFDDPADLRVIGQHAADSRAGTVAGPDDLPDLVVGRIPARDPGQLDAAIAKVLSTGSADTAAAWTRRLLITHGRSVRPGDRFEEVAAELSARVPVPFDARTATPEEVAARGLASVLDEAGGAAVVLHLGHGGIDRWADPGDFFQPRLSADDAAGLLEGGPHPVFVDGGSLLTGAYHHQLPALHEALLLARDAGAAGAVAPSGDLPADLGQEIVVAASDALLGADRVRTLGELAERVRRALDGLGGPRTPQAVTGLVLLGDPAMPLPLPIPDGPTILAAVGQGDHVALAWEPPAEELPGATYRVRRARSAAGPYELLVPWVAGTSHEDRDVVADTVYHYRVTLVAPDGVESAASNRASASLAQGGELEVLGCLPSSGPLAGGQPVRVVGRGFQPGSVAALGGRECEATTWLSESLLECLTPEGEAGLADVEVTLPDRRSDTAERAYLYCPDHDRPAAPDAAPVGAGLADRPLRRSLADRRLRPPGLPRASLPGPRPDDPQPLAHEDEHDGRPDSLEPVIDPGLSRILLPPPDCGLR